LLIYRKGKLLLQIKALVILLYGVRKILIENIKGYKIAQKVIYIYPISSQFSKLSINDYLSLDDTEELTELLGKISIDLERAAYHKDEQAILNDTEIGSTKEQREDRFENAIIYSIVYNISGVVLFVLSFMLRIDNIILQIILLLHPLLGLAIIAVTKGMVRLFAKLDSSAYRSIYLGIFFSELCLINGVLDSGKAYSNTNLWWQEIVGGVVFFLISMAVLFKMPTRVIFIQLFFVLLFAVGYGFGSALEINYILK